LGSYCLFYRSLTRKPTKSWSSSGASGPHKGILTENIPWELAVLCMDGDKGINIGMYLALHTTIDFDGMHDLLELRDVQLSWSEAAILNAKL